MDRVVYLLGLHHCDQRPRPDESGEGLRKRLCAEILTHGIDLVGEEDDPGSRPGRSIAHELAENLGLNYVNLDPDKAEREERGIPSCVDQEVLRQALAAAEMTCEAQQAALCEEERKIAVLREPIWIEKLLGHSESWTAMLFVLGAGHVESFMARLLAEGFRAEVVELDWSRGHPCKPSGC